MVFQLTSSKLCTLPDGRRLRYAVVDPKTPPKATIIIAPGRREFIEKKQYEWQAAMTARGFRQIYFEWFGQGLSDRFFTGNARQRDHAEAGTFDRHVADLQSFYTSTLKPIIKIKLVVTGHSLGGHLMLRWLAEHRPPEVNAAILTAPMMTIGNEIFLATASSVSPLVCSHGRGDTYAFSQHDYGTDDTKFADNPLSHDVERFAYMEQAFTQHPDLTVGGVTWGWMQEATRSIHLARRLGYLAAITTPCLTLSGEADQVTPPRSMSRPMNSIKNSSNLMIEGARHDLMNESDPYRNQAIYYIDEFLTRHGITRRTEPALATLNK